MLKHRRVPPIYFFFLLLLPFLIFGSCLRTRSISRADHKRMRIPPTILEGGAEILPDKICRCRLMRLSLRRRAASVVDKVRIVLLTVTDEVRPVKKNRAGYFRRPGLRFRARFLSKSIRRPRPSPPALSEPHPKRGEYAQADGGWESVNKVDSLAASC